MMNKHVEQVRCVGKSEGRDVGSHNPPKQELWIIVLHAHKSVEYSRNIKISDLMGVCYWLITLNWMLQLVHTEML